MREINGIQVTDEEIAGALKYAHDSLVDIPNPAGGNMPLTVICRANTDESYRVDSVAVNIKRDLPRFMDLPFICCKRGEPIAIVGGGPSVKRDLDKIRKFKWIMAAGSSHDYLISQGIIPTFALATDSKEETKNFYKNPHKDVHYLIASQCPPALFDQLEGHKIALWHFFDQVDNKHYLGEQAIGWGCMVGVVAIQIALYLGFQEHHYFGYDCSFEGKKTHAYKVSAKEKKEILGAVTIATIGDEKTQFATTTSMLCQVTHFFGVYRCPDGMFLKGYVYGGGLLWDVIRQSPPEMKQWLEAA